MDILSKEEAKKQGKKFFFTDIPCKRGHKDFRYVSTTQCVSCQKEHKKEYTKQGKNKEYYLNNKEVINQKTKNYRKLNKEKITERQKIYAENNKQKIQEYKKKYHIENREKIIAKVKKYYYENKEEISRKSFEYRQHTKDKKAAYDRQFDIKNKAYRNSLKMTNRAKRRQRYIEWDPEFFEFVFEEAYRLCDDRKKTTGIEWHVDHIYPLCSKTVSGLHNPYNIQVVPAKWNLSKGNRHCEAYFPTF